MDLDVIRLKILISKKIDEPTKELLANRFFAPAVIQTAMQQKQTLTNLLALCSC